MSVFYFLVIMHRRQEKIIIISQKPVMYSAVTMTLQTSTRF